MTDLTQLPVELFLTICELAYEPHGTYLALVSRAFVPFARERLFGGGLCAYAPEAFNKLVDVLVASPGAASTVEKLEIPVFTTYDIDQLDTRAFLQALSYMTSLEELEISSVLSEAVLEPTKTGLLPQLKELTVFGELKNWRNPFSPAHYRNLAHYANLKSLTLIVVGPGATVDQHIPPNPAVRLPSRLERLHLHGPIFGDAGARELVDSLSSGTRLIIQDILSGRMASFLSSLTSPHNFSTLSLEQNSREGVEDISSVLGRFSNTKCLIFGSGIAISPLLPVLAVMPALTEVHFGRGIYATGSDILPLVEGPHKPQRLHRFVIDVDCRDTETRRRFYDDIVKLVELCEGSPLILEGITVDWFREFGSIRALTILEAESSLDTDAARRSLVSTDVRDLFSPFDLKRLDSYGNNMLDYHVILDHLPTLAALYFSRRFPADVKLSGVQASILCALGLQRKSVEDIESELQLPVAQTLALFVKVIRKLTKALQEVLKEDVARFLPTEDAAAATAARILPASAPSGVATTLSHKQALAKQLEDEGNEVIKHLREEQREVIDSLDLKQYAISGSRDEWVAAHAQVAAEVAGGKERLSTTDARAVGGKKDKKDKKRRKA
ncbi:hypothetical protein JCM3770_001025 [Rhodotorula araucariae]